MTAVLLAAVVLGGLEAVGRSRGWTPAFQDTFELWSHWRGQVYQKHTVVLLGSSRTLLGLDPRAMEQAAPHSHFVQLAINGSGAPLAMLEDLADDPDFEGTVVFEFYPSAFFGARGWEEGEQTAREYARRFRERGLVAPLETTLRMGLQETFVVMRREMSLTGLVFNLAVRRRFPAKDFIEVERSRFQAADYRSKRDPPRTWTIDAETLMDPRQRASRYAHVNELVRRIRGRGGEVVFFRMVASGYVRELENELLPRERYWDEFVARTEALALHFEDVSTLTGYQCPDGRHLDADDARAFSRSLVAELARRGWIGSDP